MLYTVIDFKETKASINSFLARYRGIYEKHMYREQMPFTEKKTYIYLMIIRTADWNGKW